MKIKAKGLAKHHFWGNYSADVFLVFETEKDAVTALPVLTAGLELTGERVYNACGGACVVKGWTQKDRACHVWAGTQDLERIQNQLTALGAERKKILSLAKSIDSGEWFQIEIELE